MSDDIDDDEQSNLAAEYALGLLSEQEASAFEQLMAVDPSLRESYRVWIVHFTQLTDGIAPVAPPRGLERNIIDRLFGDETPDTTGIFGRLRFLRPMLTGLAAAAAVLLLINFSGIMDPRQSQPARLPLMFAELTADDQSFLVQAQFNPNTNALILSRDVGSPRPGRALEMWLIAADQAPVSLGVWPKGQKVATLIVPENLVAQFDGALLAVSDEPVGGSLTGAPSGDVLAIGPVNQT